MPQSPLLDLKSKKKTIHNLRSALLDAMTRDEFPNDRSSAWKALNDFRTYFLNLKNTRSDLAAALLFYVQSDEFVSGIRYNTAVYEGDGEEAPDYRDFDNLTLPMPQGKNLEKLLYIYGAPEQRNSSISAITSAVSAIGVFLNDNRDILGNLLYSRMFAAYERLDAVQCTSDVSLYTWLNAMQSAAETLIPMGNSLPTKEMRTEFNRLMTWHHDAMANMILGHRGTAQVNYFIDTVESENTSLVNYLNIEQGALGPNLYARLAHTLEQAKQTPHGTDEEITNWLKVHRNAAEMVKKAANSLGGELKEYLLQHVTEYLTAINHVTLGFHGPIEVKGLKAPAAVSDRAYNLKLFSQKLDSLRSYGHSDEWKAMEAALNQAQQLMKTMTDDNLTENGDPATKRRLASSLNLLRKTAHNYVLHKYKPDMERGSEDFRRMQMARELERYADFDLIQARQMAELADRRDHISSDTNEHSLQEQADALQRQKAVLQMFLTDMAASESGAIGFSNEYHNMKNTLTRLCNGGVPDLAALQEGHDAAWEGYRNSLDALLALANAYIEHKQRHNDAGSSSMEHLEQALQLRDYIAHLRNADRSISINNPYHKRSDIHDNYLADDDSSEFIDEEEPQERQEVLDEQEEANNSYSSDDDNEEAIQIRDQERRQNNNLKELEESIGGVRETLKINLFPGGKLVSQADFDGEVKFDTIASIYNIYAYERYNILKQKNRSLLNKEDLAFITNIEEKGIDAALSTMLDADGTDLTRPSAQLRPEKLSLKTALAMLDPALSPKVTSLIMRGKDLSQALAFSDRMLFEDNEDGPDDIQIIVHDEDEIIREGKAKVLTKEEEDLMHEQKLMVKTFTDDWNDAQEDETLFGKDQNGRQRTSRIPRPALITGNKDVIRHCLDNRRNTKLSDNDVKHLENRLKVMNHLDKLEQFYNDPKYKPVKTGPAVLKDDGFLTLPLSLDRKQDGRNSCWSCAFSILLQSRGVKVDPTLIRRYRPELSVTSASLVPDKKILNANSDSINEMCSYFSLVDKVCPNTVMKKFTFNPSTPDEAGKVPQIEAVTERVKDFLLKKNTPVAMTDGSHWVTIIGYNEKTGMFKVLDSSYRQNESMKLDLTKEIDLVQMMMNSKTILAKNKKNLCLDFVTVQDLDLKAEPNVKTGSHGEILMNPDNNPAAFVINSDFPTTRAGITVAEKGMVTYYPSMLRDYKVDYRTQKQESQQALKDLQAKDAAEQLLMEVRSNLRSSKKNDQKEQGRQMQDPDVFRAMCKNAAALPDVKEFAAEGLQEFCDGRKLLEHYMKFLQKKYPDMAVLHSKIQEFTAIPKIVEKQNHNNEIKLNIW